MWTKSGNSGTAQGYHFRCANETRAQRPRFPVDWPLS